MGWTMWRSAHEGEVFPVGELFRVGHMGNICINELVLTLYAVERSLTALGVKVAQGAAVGAAWAEWHKG